MKVFTTNKGNIIKSWTDYVPLDEKSIEQISNIADLPFIFKYPALMPDAHTGIGATVGSVIPTTKAIIPAAVGVDIGCGMIAGKLNLNASDLPDNLKDLRIKLEENIPHGTPNSSTPKYYGINKDISKSTIALWKEKLEVKFNGIKEKYPQLENKLMLNQLGTLGGGNHFIEICLDTKNQVWIMLHSGSRGVGNNIGKFFIEKAKEEMKRFFINLPDQDLAYLPEDSKYYSDYIYAVEWAQEYASLNRQIMFNKALSVLSTFLNKPITLIETAINCHHNYISKENHFGQNILVTRKGAIRARKNELGIIPGSMGAKSFIVRGLGNSESFCSCSHGAGRVMSRTEAKKLINVDKHIVDTKGVECKKDESVLDESPSAYKSIEQVMKSQEDLVEIVYELKQILCIKG